MNTDFKKLATFLFDEGHTDIDMFVLHAGALFDEAYRGVVLKNTPSDLVQSGSPIYLAGAFRIK